MNVIAKVLMSKKLEFDGKKFVKIQGFINDIGIFQKTVREELVPDNIEGKEVCMMFGIGIDSKLNPYLNLKGISLDTSIEE